MGKYRNLKTRRASRLTIYIVLKGSVNWIHTNHEQNPKMCKGTKDVGMSHLNRYIMPCGNYAIIGIDHLGSNSLTQADGHDFNRGDAPSSIPPQVKQTTKNEQYLLVRAEKMQAQKIPLQMTWAKGQCPED